MPTLRQKRWLSIANQALLAGEKISLKYFDYNRTSLYDFKEYREIVTDADTKTNDAILGVLHKLTPEIPVLSEEGADINREALSNADLAWVLDPIDGTTNFAARLPLWGISLALVQNGEPILGVISLPNLGQRYHAIKGEGAWMGKQRLTVTSTKKIDNSLGLLCYGYSGPHIQKGLKMMNQFSKVTRAARRLGAAVIEATWVASGRADFSILNGVRPWDIA
ncbi:hypothetical protein GF380_03385, partial [Candidatus Uhrbacteria bacterium]|nr:hypothetical protein [Candidatus Uhrbacteria bacterium]MBD3284175.1 hypothetical protein [Candidatus Uhrbacteria bacterium]